MGEGIHIMQKGERWVVMRGNYTLDEFKTQQQALQLAKQRAKTTRSKLIVHGEDGSVRVIDDGKAVESASRRVRRSA